MEPLIINLDAFNVVGVSFIANLQEIEEGKLGKKAFESMKERVDEVVGRSSDSIYLIQIYPMKPNFNPHVDRFTQIIGYAVSASVVSEAPLDMIRHTVPANRYVRSTHIGLESELGRTYEFLYGKYIGQLGTHPIGYDFELWDSRYKPESSDNEIDVHIAIA
ncbi:GyrI-like domain-containing protein [Cohnella sp.]|uniref:GyrI-like domain-containing protein n=1 Tax=Cohnella sp. TaxID=1883426 RepID=UPI003561F014